MKDNYRIIDYGDYPKYRDVFEFYDLDNDIEEKKIFSRTDLQSFPS